MSTAARRPQLATPEPVVIRERLPLRVAAILLLLGMALGAALLLTGLVWGFLWPKAERTPVILEVRQDTLGAGQTQLYPEDPNYIVLLMDGTGRLVQVRMTAEAVEALREWVGEL